MSELFLKVVNMSISASWLVLAVVLLRLVLKKSPKWVGVLLWGIVAVRLLCPFSVESALSLIPSAETIPDTVLSGPNFEVQTGVDILDEPINDYIADHYFEGVTVPTSYGIQVTTLLGVLWGVGVLLMAAYALISYRCLRRKVKTAILWKDSIFQSEHVDTPFVFGIVRPKIYLPFHMDGETVEYVVAHELAHIRRKDHWWKPLGFLLLALHWFNPLLWLAYVLLCRDIELACDEKVIKDLGSGQRADYTQALLRCSISPRLIRVCPLAFGEVGVKERVKSVLYYKKPTFWIIVVSILACGAVAVCFLTDPKENDVEDVPPVASDEQIEHGDGEKDEQKQVELSNTEKITETTYEYYPDGTVKESVEQNGEEFIRTKYREDGTKAWVHKEDGEYTVDEVYNEAGKRIKYTSEYKNGTRSEYTYDSEGRLLTSSSSFWNQTELFHVFIYYDNGNKKYAYYKHTSRIDDVDVVDEIESYFNEDGSLAAEYYRLLGYEGVLTSPSQEISTEITYDSEGNKTTKTLYQSGKIWETKHDASGKRLWEKTTQPSGTTSEMFY